VKESVIVPVLVHSAQGCPYNLGFCNKASHQIFLQPYLRYWLHSGWKDMLGTDGSPLWLGHIQTQPFWTFLTYPFFEFFALSFNLSNFPALLLTRIYCKISVCITIIPIVQHSNSTSSHTPAIQTWLAAVTIFLAKETFPLCSVSVI
jgi:hypothetical protein